LKSASISILLPNPSATLIASVVVPVLQRSSSKPWYQQSCLHIQTLSLLQPVHWLQLQGMCCERMILRTALLIRYGCSPPLEPYLHIHGSAHALYSHDAARLCYRLKVCQHFHLHAAHLHRAIGHAATPRVRNRMWCHGPLISMYRLSGHPFSCWNWWFCSLKGKLNRSTGSCAAHIGLGSTRPSAERE